MFGHLPPTFSEIQRETHQGQIGKQAHDEQTYAVLYGDGSVRPRRRLFRPAFVAAVVSLIGVLLVWLARF
jgi:hypothetical protein